VTGTPELAKSSSLRVTRLRLPCKAVAAIRESMAGIVLPCFSSSAVSSPQRSMMGVSMGRTLSSKRSSRSTSSHSSRARLRVESGSLYSFFDLANGDDAEMEPFFVNAVDPADHARVWLHRDKLGNRARVKQESHSSISFRAGLLSLARSISIPVSGDSRKKSESLPLDAIIFP